MPFALARTVYLVFLGCSEACWGLIEYVRREHFNLTAFDIVANAFGNSL